MSSKGDFYIFKKAQNGTIRRLNFIFDEKSAFKKEVFIIQNLKKLSNSYSKHKTLFLSCRST